MSIKVWSGFPDVETREIQRESSGSKHSYNELARVSHRFQRGSFAGASLLVSQDGEIICKFSVDNCKF